MDKSHKKTLSLNLIRHAKDLMKELINVKVSVVPDCHILGVYGYPIVFHSRQPIFKSDNDYYKHTIKRKILSKLAKNSVEVSKFY